MITTPTTFVLGAGASNDVGYPCGEALADRILTTVEKGNGLYNAAVDVGFAEDKILSFYEDFSAAALPTIDEYLRHSPRHRDIGRFAIAYELTSHEDEQNLKRTGRGSWYYEFRQLLGSGFDDLIENKCQIVTFNYDRSLEHYLYLAYSAVSRDKSNYVSVQSALTAILSPLHIHGSLSQLPWQSPQGRRYGLPKDPTVALEASRGIVLAHDRHQSELQWSDGRSISEAMANSDRIVFLGFGFAESNLLKLGLDAVRNDSKKVFVSSSFKLKSQSIDAAKAYIPSISFYQSINEILKTL